MLTLPSSVRVFIYSESVDMRCGLTSCRCWPKAYSDIMEQFALARVEHRYTPVNSRSVVTIHHVDSSFVSTSLKICDLTCCDRLGHVSISRLRSGGIGGGDSAKMPDRVPDSAPPLFGSNR